MADHSAEPDPDARVTSPMQEFTGGQVLTGGIVLLIGLAIAYLVPALLL
ncbi:DUF7550 family protein [Halopenitus persicus]|uniref:Uncharacterized protein n=1 Tax=Halopenitus persicus TaxID=1048396 RepID=A0A1H3H442_9EURY|nr:hypothetical protein [Halopenitus persicus]SDY09995.1 hypothetical protein SAMN05216564_103104 [Halopenitus persicus]